MREKSTGWPILPGSGVKGVWRDHYSQQPDAKPLVEAAFGQEASDSEDRAGSLVISDARIVLLPVRSFYGTFAYVTSPLALLRLRRDLEQAQLAQIPPEIAEPAGENNVLLPNEPASQIAKDGKVYFEDLDFTSVAAPNAAHWAAFLSTAIFAPEWQAVFKTRLAIVPNTTFDFLCQVGTEVNTRIRLEDEVKIVKQGQLWQEESLPAETVLAGMVWCDRVFQSSTGQGRGEQPAQILETFCKQPVFCQMGGKASVGKGRVACRFSS
jgi:CRISPR-associated protein Cmr4